MCTCMRRRSINCNSAKGERYPEKFIRPIYLTQIYVHSFKIDISLDPIYKSQIMLTFEIDYLDQNKFIRTIHLK